MMEFVLFVCPLCGDATTYHTLDEVANHRLARHERPHPPYTPRLEAESGIVGRARQTPWSRDFTHWHAARIAGRA